jgi:hypothetical protein
VVVVEHRHEALVRRQRQRLAPLGAEAPRKGRALGVTGALSSGLPHVVDHHLERELSLSRRPQPDAEDHRHAAFAVAEGANDVVVAAGAPLLALRREAGRAGGGHLRTRG